MKKCIILLAVMLIANSVTAQTRQSIVNYPLQNQYYNNPNYYRPHISTSDLSALEKYSMNRTFPKEYPLHRLERLENLTFGATQYGDLQTRLKNVESAILSRPGVNINRRNWVGNLANYFAGQATGITPSISMPDYQNYLPIYGSDSGTQRFEQFSNGIFGGGYSLMNQNLGNGSSVRILP